ncbi:MAG TPA: hypothetical protein VHY10_18065, partial [Xanthobacteraceae bacterium]|nr:hypothetical protein [Xanthobacteraceae bacterium]
PQYWEKTEHGLAKTSRSAGNRQSQLDRRQNNHGPAYLVSTAAMDRGAPAAPLRIIRTAHAGMRDGAT